MESVNKIPVPTNTYRVIPVFEAMRLANNKVPKGSTPVDTYGTIQSNADDQAITDITLYNPNGQLVNTRSNSLIGKV
jgi:hypothetical protein